MMPSLPPSEDKGLCLHPAFLVALSAQAIGRRGEKMFSCVGYIFP